MAFKYEYTLTHANLHSRRISRVSLRTRETSEVIKNRSHPHYINEITHERCEQQIMQIMHKVLFIQNLTLSGGNLLHETRASVLQICFFPTLSSFFILIMKRETKWLV